MKDIKVNIHSSICIDNDIYIDPYQITEHKKNAKAIFITHSHYDHLDMPSINNISTSDTVIVAPRDCIQVLREEGYQDENLIEVMPNESGKVYDIDYETFASYNTNKPFHPKTKNWVGYKLLIDGTYYTICGDSDDTEVLESLKTDILFVPIGGTYTMTAEEAAHLTNIIKPKVVVPVHYGSIVGDKKDGVTFSKLINSNTQVMLLI